MAAQRRLTHPTILLAICVRTCRNRWGELEYPPFLHPAVLNASTFSLPFLHLALFFESFLNFLMALLHPLSVLLIWFWMYACLWAFGTLQGHLMSGKFGARRHHWSLIKGCLSMQPVPVDEHRFAYTTCLSLRHVKNKLTFVGEIFLQPI